MALKLPRLSLNYQKTPGLFERYWDQAMTKIEEAFNGFSSVNTELSLLMSFVSTANLNVITADSTGKIVIADHTRVYGDGAQVPVSGGSFNSGMSPGKIIRIYYSDDNLAGGNVRYQYTVDPDDKPVQHNGTHNVGAVVVPSTGTVSGKSLDPAGTIYL